MLGETLGDSDHGGVCPTFPLLSQPWKSAQLLGWVLHLQRSPLGQVGPVSLRGRPGETRRGRCEGPSRTRGGGEEKRTFAPLTQALGAC